MAQVFISYAAEDRERARTLAGALEARGWSVWWDRSIPPGMSFDEVIEAELSAAQCVVVLWSAASVRSRWVKAEAAEADARGLLVPVLIEPCTLPLGFRQIHAADLTGWRGEPSDPGLETFAAAVARCVAAAPAGASAPGARPRLLRAPPSEKRRGTSVVRSVVAVLVGAVVAIPIAMALTLAAKSAAHAFEIEYRTYLVLLLACLCVAQVAAGWVTARLAPSRPVLHAVVLGASFALIDFGSTIGAEAAVAPYLVWAALAVPCAWLGGWLRERQLRTAAPVRIQAG